MVRPAALLLLIASSAQGQTAPQTKAAVDSSPRLRPAISLPATAAKPAANAPRIASKPVAAVRPSTGACRIQAGTFSRRANADNLAKALKPLGDVRVTAMTLDGKPVHLVTLTGLGTRKNAQTVLDRLKASGRDLGPLSVSGCPA